MKINLQCISYDKYAEIEYIEMSSKHRNATTFEERDILYGINCPQSL